MKTGGAAVDVHYPNTGGARAAAVLAADAAFAHAGRTHRDGSPVACLPAE